MYSINLIYLVIKFNFYNCSFLVFFVSQYVNELCGESPQTSKIICLDYYLVENIGVEPMTSCVQGRRSSQLS